MREQSHNRATDNVEARAPYGHEHGRVAFRIGYLIGLHAKANGLGAVYATGTGFHLKPDAASATPVDVGFVARERIEAYAGLGGCVPTSPDFAAEVVSPQDCFSDVMEKVIRLLDAGTRMVLVADPERRAVAVYLPSGCDLWLDSAGTIDCGDVIPGLRVPVRDLFN